ncbi:MAG: UDP-N-acetylmuramoyl-L-alanine--D-glutamate ligase [Methylobacterium sp.]|nr:MAG: UDP-N-acetylmuramoyl-L-alanine--D-glutamate ligase [Methylobacterium sp.]
MIPVESYRGRRVALFGLGGSGLATAKALVAGGADVTVWDDSASAIEKARAAGLHAADLRELDWKGVAALVLSPGVPLTHPEPHWSVKLAHAFAVPVIGDVDLFFRERARRAPDALVICITGTNGKSTTTALVAHLLAEAGFDVEMGGNIGTPVLELEPPAADAPRRVHVLECSSYQIDLAPTISPTIGIHLNLSPDHIDRHGTFDRYAAVKERMIAAAQIAIVGIDDPASEAIALRHAKTGGRTVTLSVVAKHGASLHVTGRAIVNNQGDTLADLTGIGALRGAHNGQNAAAAVAACLQLSVPRAVIQKGLSTFPGLAHRMEQVGRVGRALAINDSKATNADSTEKALLAFEQGLFWICGGKPKAGGIADLAPLFPRVAKAYLIGEAAEAFSETLGDTVPHMIAGTLDVAVNQAVADANHSEFNEPVILLSPSCASFDQFPNFEVRGRTFRDLVSALPDFRPL